MRETVGYLVICLVSGVLDVILSESRVCNVEINFLRIGKADRICGTLAESVATIHGYHIGVLGVICDELCDGKEEEIEA